MRLSVCTLVGLSLLVSAAPAIVAEEEAPEALTWHHEGFAALTRAAGEAKAQGKRLLVGLSGGPT